MFCYQCEQTKSGTACLDTGNCGKDAPTAALQDVLVHVACQVGTLAHKAAQLGKRDPKIDVFVVEALFTTVTNVNFDPKNVERWIAEGLKVRARAAALAGEPEPANCPVQVALNSGTEALLRFAETVSISQRIKELGPDIAGLVELLIYGLKGSAAYLHHAMVLGFEDTQLYEGIHEGLAFVTSGPKTVEALVPKALWEGELNFAVMELLDRANTTAYGHPEPTAARISAVKGKCILVSGHDLKDLEELLKQTEGTGIHVYTHGEMLPALAYPGLKKYSHLIGNYGGAWQNQVREFRNFPGPILMTTNCIQKPADEYFDRIFTSGVVQWPGVKHLANRDFRPVIESALASPGFAEDEPEVRIPIGFARNAVLERAGVVIDAVKSGAIKHFFLIGGCDGALHGRNYYTELAQKVPQDCVILTLACGKFRFNKLEFGDIGGIPRILDMGQCNDAYSAIMVAGALADAFGCSVNDLPLSLVLSWYEQKAVCILLTLLYLGIRDIRLGPTLPAFLTPTVVGALVEHFHLKPTGRPEADLECALAGR